MKMEHVLRGPADGVIVALRYGLGGLVTEGSELCEFEVAGAG